jgi:hypothetical protein
LTGLIGLQLFFFKQGPMLQNFLRKEVTNFRKKLESLTLASLACPV